MLEAFTSAVGFTIYLLEAVGVLVILGGFLTATVILVQHYGEHSTHESYLMYRRRSVRGLILGLEFLVAADIIKTITVDYSIDSVLMLGLIILIRTFLVFALHMEIEGRLPWEPSGSEEEGGQV